MIAKGAMAEHEKMGGRIITFYIRYIAYDQSVFFNGIFYAGKTGLYVTAGTAGANAEIRGCIGRRCFR